MLMAEVTFWHYCLFLLLQEIQKPVKRVIQKYSCDDNDDKLSDFPDCVLLHILSFLNTKYAVQTCVLSKRWMNLWKRLPSFIIGYSHFKDLKGFEYFVHGFLGTRDRSTALQVLDFRQECLVGYQSHLEWIVRYAFTHNIKRVRIHVRKVKHFRFCFFSCDTLTSLHISVASPRTLFPNSLNFPALTYLYLGSFDFRVDDDGLVEPFSAFKRLNSLILQYCRVLEKQNLCIYIECLTRQFNNTWKLLGFWLLQLGVIHTPNLCTYVYKGCYVQQLCGSKSNLSSVKHATIIVISLSESCKDFIDSIQLVD